MPFNYGRADDCSAPSCGIVIFIWFAQLNHLAVCRNILWLAFPWLATPLNLLFLACHTIKFILGTSVISSSSCSLPLPFLVSLTRRIKSANAILLSCGLRGLSSIMFLLALQLGFLLNCMWLIYSRGHRLLVTCPCAFTIDKAFLSL